METPGQKITWVQKFKFMTIGDEAVGKSCLLLQFVDQKFRSHLDVTIGFESSSRIINIGDKITKLYIVDTSGRDIFRSQSRSFYRGAAAAILVYDITRRETFDHVGSWLKDAKEFTLANVTIILVGNKCDLSQNRAVSYEEGEAFAKEHGLIFMESSAKTNKNVEEVFFTAARIVSKKIEDGAIHISAKFCGNTIPSPKFFKEEGGGSSGVGGGGGGGCCSQMAALLEIFKFHI